MGYSLHSAISALLHLKRKCPKCGREQIVPASDRDKTVRCKFCHEAVPAPAHREGSNEEENNEEGNNEEGNNEEGNNEEGNNEEAVPGHEEEAG